MAIARIFARIRKEHRLYFDDAFFFLATISLVAGTILIFIDIPFIYMQEDVEAGLREPPADLMTRLIESEKIQDAATVLLALTIFSVKFSFLFFFRHLLRLQKKMMYYWWLICCIVVPSGIVFMFSDFIACDYFDERIIVECTTAGALARENGTLYASVVLDVVTDSLLISIPILLLWNVQISLRRKMILGGILCLSVLMIIIAIVRVATGKNAKGQVDTAWVIFWLQAEACVALMVVSVSAFRALFVAQRASKYNHDLESRRERQDESQAKLWTSRMKHDKILPSVSSPVLTGVRTQITNDSYGDQDLQFKSGELELPLQGTGILVTQDLSSEEKVNSLAYVAEES